MVPPNPGVAGASPHAVQIQVDTGCQGTLALGVGNGICPRPRTFSLSLALSWSLLLARQLPFLQCCSCFTEFLPYLHSSDLSENSFSPRVKNLPRSRLRFFLVLPLVSRERLRRSCLATKTFEIHLVQSFLTKRV